MQIVLLACRPIAPAPPFPPTLVARCAYFLIQIELNFPIIEHHGELGATWVEIKPAGLAVVHKTLDVLFACIAVAGGVARRVREELERAFGVERVVDSRGRHCTVHVEVEVAYATFIA
ncbi:hypothetical protein F2P56_029258 [Juglans regia]|uniref:Uncharacterized protein n=1 Tax=Juglans regia TaxID=51240 RepID=A0A833U2I9_JUGRE|nr:hypothetical protein F2P56_029258 [Juglans regia]